MFRAFTLLQMLFATTIAWPALAQIVGPSPAPANAAQATAPDQHDPDEVLAENAQMKLTRADYDADIQRLPAEMRNEFASNPQRLSAYLNNLLIVKTLAADARQAGLESEPLLQRRAALEVDRLLADAQLRHLEQVAGKEFDAKSSEYKTKAKELYLVDRNKYRVPELISASQIVFETKQRKPEEALALANETRRKLLAGADFAATAKEVSDDPSAKNNGGEIGWFARERMDPAFSKAAFDMKNVGDISEPVLSSFGYHLIRFEGRKPPDVLPYEAVEPQIMAELRKRYVEGQRDARTAAIRNDPNLKVNQAAVDSLVFHTDPGAFGLGAPRRRGKAE